MNFIEKLAKKIHSENKSLSDLTIILPSERAKKYLTSELFKVYEKPILAPEITTMDKWVKSYSQETVIDKTRTLILLYKIHQKANLNNTSPSQLTADISFDEFLNWGTTLLSDFNEIDRYLLDAKQVFRNLADIKEIEQWSFGEEKLTESQVKFMEFWDQLPGYYYELNKQLKAIKSCYAGKSFQFLSDNIDILFKVNKAKTFIFAGFNALSKAELSILKQLHVMGRADIIIDADDYYLKNKAHEAGAFLRELSVVLDKNDLDFTSNELKKKALLVDVIECAQKTGQVKAASTLLSQMNQQEIDDTLLLLADESLIGAITKNLPKTIRKANITLGLPIRNTSLKTWVELIFSIQQNKKRFKTESLYFSDLQDFGNHPFVLGIINNDEKKMLIQAEKQIVKYNRIFVNPKNLKIGTQTRQLLDTICENWKTNTVDSSWEKAMTNVRALNQLVYMNLQDEFSFEKAVIEAFDKSLVDFENIISEGLPPMDMKSFEHLFNQHWGMKSIAYHGNPLNGLQIMGLLETRALDFKRIICVGMNEGQMPPTNPIQTMIPMDLRRFLGLPTPRDKQGLFAHHFYRLLHKCEHLTVTYTSADESIGSNEPSRYLMQLEMELSRENTNVKVNHQIYSLQGESRSDIQLIEKTKEIQCRMDELFERSTSASMIKSYITCPLDFYYRYVMEFGEEDTVEEDIESNTFGTFIHDTLEILYMPFARFNKAGEKVDPAPSNITSFDIEKMLKNYSMVVEQQFMKHFNNDEDAFKKGKNFLSYKMALKLTEKFLKSEVEFLSQQKELVFIESLEAHYEQEVEIEVLGEKKKVRLRGFIDRIDSVGGKIRIIDYKSGKVKLEEVKFKKGVNSRDDVAASFSATTKKHLLQLTQYAYLYYKKHGVIPESCIVSFISEKFQPFILQGKDVDLNEIIINYPTYLGRIMEDMYNSDVPFEHADEYFSYCNYCK